MNRLLPLFFSVLALTAETRSAAIGKAPTHTRATAATRPHLSDAQLEKDIRARFAASKIAVNHFTVHVQGGVATIEGKCDVLQHKGTATRLAKSAGAVTVVNKVQVSQAAKDKAAANLAQGRRRAQIKRGELRSQ
jgi:osmotically-inducible protein OsmY